MIAERVSEPEPGMQWNKPAAKIGQPFRETLAVEIEPLPRPRGDGLGDGDRLQQSEQRDRQRAAAQARNPVPILNPRRQKRGRPLGTFIVLSTMPNCHATNAAKTTPMSISGSGILQRRSQDDASR